MPFDPLSRPTDPPRCATSAAEALSLSIPADQAIGLRLLAMARAAAAMHLAETTNPQALLEHSQAARLLRERAALAEAAA